MTLPEILNNSYPEKIILKILYDLHIEGPINPSHLEILAHIKQKFPDKFANYENRICLLLGLFFKPNLEPKDLLEEVYTILSDSIKEETKRRFTPVQARAYKSILDKTFYSFSAPTSSGKSYLLRELIQETRNDVIIVVPSRALIAEYIHTLQNQIDKRTLILQFIENVNRDKVDRRIYVVTPERGMELFKKSNELTVDLFLFDEAQIIEEPIRGMKLDAFVRRVNVGFPLAKKVFTHPFVENPEAQLLRHKIEYSMASMKFEQSAVGKIFISLNNNKFYYFSPYLKKSTSATLIEYDPVSKILIENGTILIYISKAKIYNHKYIQEFDKYISLCPKITDPNALKIVNELREYIGATEVFGDKHSFLIDMMGRGIVVHHGSIPLKARLLIESFVNNNHARICFATSTLTQGINMPFDLVWIDNYKFQGSEDRKKLDLKNLIGRSGRSTTSSNKFDFGYVLIKQSNVNSFTSRIMESAWLPSESLIDSDLASIPEDLKDVAEAIKNDSFNHELQIPEVQVLRLSESKIFKFIKLILDNLLPAGNPIEGNAYYSLKKTTQKNIKNAFKLIFIQHMRRDKLEKAELSILSTAIPIFLWQIKGRSFKQILALRYAYITSLNKQRMIRKLLKKKKISTESAKKAINEIKLAYSPQAFPIPDKDVKRIGLFGFSATYKDFDYDMLVYDTYDYIDKVISLSLSNCFEAAFQSYYNATRDERALKFIKLIKYGTDNEKEIWLLRYGFSFEDIEWLSKYVSDINEYRIEFTNHINNFNEHRLKVISRFI